MNYLNIFLRLEHRKTKASKEESGAIEKGGTRGILVVNDETSRFQTGGLEC